MHHSVKQNKFIFVNKMIQLSSVVRKSDRNLRRKKQVHSNLDVQPVCTHIKTHLRQKMVSAGSKKWTPRSGTICIAACAQHVDKPKRSTVEGCIVTRRSGRRQ